MDFTEINDFAQWESKRKETFLKKTNEEMIFADFMKLSEEIGEFANEIQKKLKMQKKEKMDSEENINKNLADEFADVILTTSIIAKRLGIDIETAIERKIDIVRARKYE